MNMIWGVRSCLSACAYTTTSTVETAWTMWYYYSLFAYLITLHTNNFSNATVYIVIIILCSVGGLPDRYVITFMRLMSPFYFKFVFTDIQIRTPHIIFIFTNVSYRQHGKKLSNSVERTRKRTILNPL
jgi:hypothetical protein